MSLARVDQYMTKDVVHVNVSETLESVVAKMRANGISGCPVTDPQGRLVGVISEVDLARVLSLGKGVTSLSGFLEALLRDTANETIDPLHVLLHRFRHLRVSSCMSSRPITVRPTDSLETAAALMRKHRINRLPVVEGESVVGVLTRTDILDAVGHRIGTRRVASERPLVPEVTP